MPNLIPTTIKNSLREFGLLRTLVKLAVFPFGIRGPGFEAAHDRFYDLLLGVDTSGVVEPENLGFGDIDSQKKASRYHGYSYNRARRMLEMAADFLNGRPLVVDAGCGEGRLNFFFAWKGFPGLGFDFSPQLIEKAQANAARFRRKSVPLQFLIADAKEFLLPDQRVVVVMFNPFDADILSRFVTNNAACMMRHESLVLYGHDHHREVLSHAGLKMLRRDDDLKLSLWTASRSSDAVR